MKITRRTLVLGALSGASIPLARIAQAQAPDDFPSKPITLIVPFPPGGSAGVVGRLVANRLSAVLGQPFIVEHKAGAGGANGSEFVARARPDGYTWLLATSGPLAHVELIRPKETPYKTLDDFEPVGFISATPTLLLARNGLPVRNMKELVAHAKQNPGKLTYGTTGIGSVLHIQMLLLQRMAGIEMLHVPYSGVGPQVTALMGGVVDFIIAGSPGSYQQIVVSGSLSKRCMPMEATA